MATRKFVLMTGKAKDLTAGVDMFYPAVFGFWKKDDKLTDAKLKKDESLQLNIEEYIKRSKQMMSEIDARIKNLLVRSPSIIVWGTGQLSMKLLVETSLAQADIVAFVDNNYVNQGKLLHGKPILAPQELGNLNFPILLTTLLHHNSIAKQIRDMGLTNEIIFLQGDY